MIAVHHAGMHAPARAALLLLLTLMSHLAVMASPLHGPAVGAPAHAHATIGAVAHQSPSPIAAPPMAPLPEPPRRADCALEAAPPAPGAAFPLLVVLALAAGTRLPLCPAEPPSRPVRALGPPVRADAQALLQVFRI